MALTIKQFTPELIIQAKFDILRIVSSLELKNNKLKEIMPTLKFHSILLLQTMNFPQQSTLTKAPKKVRIQSGWIIILFYIQFV